MEATLRVGEILKEKGITQTAFAKMIGISTVYTSDLVRNVKFPSKEVLGRMAQALDVDIRDLFVSTKEKDPNDPHEALRTIGKIVDRFR